MARQDQAAPAAGPSRHRDQKVQPPRPPNAWILYRSFKFSQIRQGNERLSQAAVSKLISDMWKNEPEDVRRHFERMADDKKAEHQQQYPDYRFAPQRREDKMRAKEERKQSRRAKKSKARDATPPDADADADAPTTTNATIPSPPTALYMPQPCLLLGYQPDLGLPSPRMTHGLRVARYGPDGPSPPISAAPSPVPYESSESPETLPSQVASSSSSSFARPSPSSESQASSSQLRLNPSHPPSLPSSQHPSPNPYATQPLPTLLFQSSPPPPVQLPSTTVWNSVPTRLSSLDSHNSEGVVHFNIPFGQPQNFAQYPRSLYDGSSVRPVGTANANGVFDLANAESSNLVALPQGELQVGVGAQASTVDYNERLFADFDFGEFERQMAAFTESSSSSVAAAQDDLQALFHAPSGPEVQAYTTGQQRQPSAFTQDMMRFFDFEAAEEDPSTVPDPPLPATVAPQQVRIQSAQHGVAMPIFTQMTNTSTGASGTSYVPPAGAINSSTRRVAGTWKPTFVTPPAQVEEPVRSWSITHELSGLGPAS